MKQGIYLLLFIFSILSSSLFGAFNGVYTISIGAPTSTNYKSFAAAFSDLNGMGRPDGGPINYALGGLVGKTTFIITPGYTETASNLYLSATGSTVTPLIFKRGIGSGANPKIVSPVTGGGFIATGAVGMNGDAMIKIIGGDFITFDGIDLEEKYAGTNKGSQIEYGYYFRRARRPGASGRGAAPPSSSRRRRTGAARAERIEARMPYTPARVRSAPALARARVHARRRPRVRLQPEA